MGAACLTQVFYARASPLQLRLRQTGLAQQPQGLLLPLRQPLAGGQALQGGLQEKHPQLWQAS